MNAVSALFDTWAAADQALAELTDAGFDRDDMQVIAGDPDRAYAEAPETGTEVPVGEAGGVGVGGLVGGVVAWLLDAAELAVAEIETLLATGPLGAALNFIDPTIAAGAGLGAFGGGLLGIHAGWSFAEGRARAYQAAVGRGEIMVTLKAPNRSAARRAEAVLRDAGARRVSRGLARG